MDETRHKYEYQIDVTADTAPARVVRIVGENKRVLEIGAGPGSITKLLFEVGNCRVTALEVDSQAIIKLAPYCERVFQADLNHLQWQNKIEQGERFDVLVAADVLEHLYDPVYVLTGMKDFLNENGYIVVSLPHIGHAAIHACLLEEDFEYRDWGLLDRTHIRFFGIKNIQKLFEDAGWKIIHAEFVVRHPEQTEFAECWARTSPDLRRVLATNPFNLVYQVVVKAVPMDAGGDAISLMALPVIASKISLGDKLKALARVHFSLKMRVKLKQAASKICIKW